MFGENSIVEMGLLCLIISILLFMLAPALQKAKNKAKAKKEKISITMSCRGISSLRSKSLISVVRLK